MRTLRRAGYRSREVCGRFTLRRPGAEVAQHFALSEIPELTPRYNAAPGQAIAAVRAVEGRGLVLELRRWGLVPPWAPDPRIGGRLINARSETAAGRRAFAPALRARRCIVPADGFFEWGSRGGERVPFHVQVRGGALFGIAGLWEEWRGAGGEVVESCTLLTTGANERLRPLHDRMPAILDPGDYDRWLDPQERDPARVEILLRPFPSEAMEAAPVGPRVNRPELDDPACLEPAPEPLQRTLPF